MRAQEAFPGSRQAKRARQDTADRRGRSPGQCEIASRPASLHPAAGIAAQGPAAQPRCLHAATRRRRDSVCGSVKAVAEERRRCSDLPRWRLGEGFRMRYVQPETASGARFDEDLGPVRSGGYSAGFFLHMASSLSPTSSWTGYVMRSGCPCEMAVSLRPLIP